MNFDGTLGNRIKEIRKENDMTLKELGEKVEVTHAFLSRIENNKVKPNDDLLIKLAEVLDYNNSQDYLNEFRVLNGFYNQIDETSDFYNELKASGRLEVEFFDPEDVDEDIKQIKGIDKYLKKRNHKRLVEHPYYKLNYLLDTKYKVFYDLKLNDYEGKTVTIELPTDFKDELYKAINTKVIELIKNYPELLLSVFDEEAMKQYNKSKEVKENEVLQNLMKNNVDLEKISEFMSSIFSEGKIY
ncbi:helix-turn-helix transcriptional regulator [Mammaliicoccus sp. F-M27]|uniref:helix-turn-helix domain-containing protein n=1 Tax=Mammaliicoccus sp. F-M27 TaxID=2898687 RepID=UPI001EFAF3C3|nr:helix-turn-helix transcriptional regulator [Mammaliicoccus sp. F-M27]